MEKKKLVTTVTAVALLGALAVGGTLAYLTDTETKTNKFTINNEVDITLTEENWKDENGEGVTPSATVAKDPAVKNNKEEDVIVFLKVESPKESVKLKGESAATSQELFWFYSGTSKPTAILTASTFDTSKWVKLNTYCDTTDTDKNTYFFGYSEKLAKNAETVKLFDYVQLKNYVDQYNAETGESINPDAADIIVTAYAIQADNLYNVDGTAAIDTSTLNETTLASIYATYLADTAVPVTPDPEPDPDPAP